MPTKLVYVSPEHYCQSDDLDILSPKQLDALLEEEGYDVIKRSNRTIKHPKTRKQIRVEYLELATKAAERGLATTRRDQLPAAHSGEDDGGGRGLSVQPDNGSYLGSGSAFTHAMRATGVNVGSNMSAGAAYGMGVDCAKLGGKASECGFQRGSLPYIEWMKGFAAGGGATPSDAEPKALRRAFEQGRKTAEGASETDEVDCPYQSGTDLFDQWLEGFKAGGGTIE
jgi:hypothetical protein